MSTAKPRPRHYVIAAASAAFHGVVTGYMWLGFYWMLAGLIWLLRAIIGWPDVPDVFAAAATAQHLPGATVRHRGARVSRTAK